MTHRDLLQPSAPGVLRDAQAARDREATPHWSMPPMSPQMPMMPGMSDLTPPVTPFLPVAAGSHVPVAHPRELVRLANGDTLVLTAGKVMRTIAKDTFTMYGFNDQYPGPLLEVKQGATIVVQYHNELDQPSSVHWHGVRLDNRFDGTVGVTQPAVSTGGSFAYTVHFIDAGIYWYHSHVREDIQQDLGLYGNILVRSTDSRYYSDVVSREEVLALDDILMNGAGLLPYGAEAPTHALMGRFGNVFLVNGEQHYTLDVDRDDVVRFFLTNASSARMYNVSFGDARMKVIAGDLGKFEREEWVKSVVIAPAERYVVDVKFGDGQQIAMVNRVQALAHIAGTYSPEIDTLGVVRVAPQSSIKHRDPEFETLHSNEDVERDLAPFRKYFGKPVDHSLVLTLATRQLPDAVSNMLLGINAAVEWNDGMPMMNWLSTGSQVQWILRDPATGKENMDIDWHFTQGDVVKLRLFNDPATSHAMQHPIHLHGQRFLVLSRDGVSNTNLVWKDTAVIPAGETVDLLVDMSNPGRWMLHCHVAEHLSAGMMSMFTVSPRGRTTPATK
jgi:FtsP/CotA-like multicopper oxidase with cupredoxin domain